MARYDVYIKSVEVYLDNGLIRFHLDNDETILIDGGQLADILVKLDRKGEL